MISYGFAHSITVSPPDTPDDLHIHPIDGKERNFRSKSWDFLEILCQVLRISQILESFGREINVIIKLDRAIFQKSQPVTHMYSYTFIPIMDSIFF